MPRDEKSWKTSKFPGRLSDKSPLSDRDRGFLEFGWSGRCGGQLDFEGRFVDFGEEPGRQQDPQGRVGQLLALGL